MDEVKIIDDALACLGLASQMAEKAAEEIEFFRAKEAAGQAIKDDVVRALLDYGILRPEQKQAAELRLDSYAGALQMLKAAAERIRDQDAVLTKRAEGEPDEFPDGSGEGSALDILREIRNPPHIGAN